MATDEPLSAALDRYRAAMGALRQGDAPRGMGPIDKGWETIADTLKWVGSRFTGGTDQVELTAVVAADLIALGKSRTWTAASS